MALHLKMMGIAVVLLSSSAPQIAQAQVCEESSLQTSLQYLRRLTIDLTGKVPSIEALEEVVASTSVDDATIDAYLDSDAFVEQMRAYHLDLLWTNVSNQRFVPNAWELTEPSERSRSPAYWSTSQGRMNNYRGGTAFCLDEPVTYDDNGDIVTTPDPDDPSNRREGWVEVEPWWALGTTVKVCAFDAQDNLTSAQPQPNGQPGDCERLMGRADCGCGPNLRWCHARSPNTERILAESFAEQLLRYIDIIVRDDTAYTDLLVGQGGEVNGPISHWLQYQTQTGGNIFPSHDIQNHSVPVISGDAIDTWESYERGLRHAGVLTMPGYMVKFPTNRSRANRFYNAFLCESFEAPSGGLPDASDSCSDEPDLTERCGCKYCHATVEPAAAHWGRWVEAGLGAMNTDLFPIYNERCTEPNARNNFACRLFYLTPNAATHDKLQEYIGTLNAYVFLDEEHEQNVEEGPIRLAQEAIESGQFATCTVTRLWRHLMHRDPYDEEVAVISELANEFASNGYSFKELVRSLIKREEYRLSERFGVKGGPS